MSATMSNIEMNKSNMITGPYIKIFQINFKHHGGQKEIFHLVRSNANCIGQCLMIETLVHDVIHEIT